MFTRSVVRPSIWNSGAKSPLSTLQSHTHRSDADARPTTTGRKMIVRYVATKRRGFSTKRASGNATAKIAIVTTSV